MCGVKRDERYKKIDLVFHYDRIHVSIYNGCTVSHYLCFSFFFSNTLYKGSLAESYFHWHLDFWKISIANKKQKRPEVNRSFF